MFTAQTEKKAPAYKKLIAAAMLRLFNVHVVLPESRRTVLHHIIDCVNIAIPAGISESPSSPLPPPEENDPSQHDQHQGVEQRDQKDSPVTN